jgi:acetoin utilization protein AcuC
MKDMIIVQSDEYANWIFDPTHPTQGRRFIKGYESIIMHGKTHGLSIETIEPQPVSAATLTEIHSPQYVDEVMVQHRSTEWAGPRPDMAHLANLFVGGTLQALEALVNGETLTAVHLPGAKHHAAYDHSSGFCVFADLAIAAKRITDMGLRVAILDVDVHHGDGTEALTFENENVLTYSIPQYGIFPGTGLRDDLQKKVFNWPLNEGEGDRALKQGITDFLTLAQEFAPHYIFIAGGADGHHTDPLSSINYTVDGMESAMEAVRDAFPVTPILFGGAGGYQPDGATPLAWSRMAVALGR